MKRIDFLVLFAGMVMLVACGGNRNGYVLTGTVPEDITDDEIVYMTDYNDGQIIDQAIVSGGKFVFKGVADSAMARLLTIQDLQADIIIDKGKMTIDLSDPYSARGNFLTEQLNEFYLRCGEVIMLARNRISGIDDSLTEEEKSELEDAIFEDFFSQLDAIPESYLKEHPNDALGAMIFYIWMQNQVDLSAAQFQEAASRLAGEYILNFGPIKQMSEYLATVDNTSVGQPFVDFTIPNGNPDGSSVSLSDYVGKGKYVLVDFWASWCMPCRMEAPVIAEVYEKYKGDRFEVLGVAVHDRRDASLQVIKEDGYKWPQILDAQSIPLELYGINGIPHIILFGPDGTILARQLRDDVLRKTVAEVMTQ